MLNIKIRDKLSIAVLNSSCGGNRFVGICSGRIISGTDVAGEYENNRKNGARIKNVPQNGTVTQTVKKLKAKKKYYVQLRTYKKIKGNKIYSDWSAVKSVTVKK